MQSTSKSTSKSQTSWIVLATVIVLIGAGFGAWKFNRMKSEARLQSELQALTNEASSVRSELLGLYRERLSRAEHLLAFLKAPPLDPAWTKAQDWTLDSEQDLARFDETQSKISNQIAEAIVKSTIRSDIKPANAKRAILDFEKFEQLIVKKRERYAAVVDSFQNTATSMFQPGSADVASPTSPPQFPAEKLRANQKTR